MSRLLAIRNPLGKPSRHIELGGYLCRGRTVGHRTCRSGDD